MAGTGVVKGLEYPGLNIGAAVVDSGVGGKVVGEGVGKNRPRPGYLTGVVSEGLIVGSGVGARVGSKVGFLYPPGYIRGLTLGTEEDRTEGEDAGLSTDGSVGVARAEWCLEEECSAFLFSLEEEWSAALFFFDDLDDELFRMRSSISLSSRAVHDSDH